MPATWSDDYWNRITLLSCDLFDLIELTTSFLRHQLYLLRADCEFMHGADVFVMRIRSILIEGQVVANAFFTLERDFNVPVRRA